MRVYAPFRFMVVYSFYFLSHTTSVYLLADISRFVAASDLVTSLNPEDTQKLISSSAEKKD